MLEALCFIIALAKVSLGEINTVNSFALEYENSKNSKIENMMVISDMLSMASEFVTYSQNIQDFAEELENEGIAGMDALHLACAEIARARYFITCDDALLKKINQVKHIKVKTLTILEFISKEVFK
jgi:predicted nucleic acid-binding protein